MSITRTFPWLHALVRTPRYFAHCFTHRTRTPLSVAHDTPALFVGGADTVSHLHVDQMRSNFWMYVGEGYKHWTCFHPDDTQLLKPTWDDEDQLHRFPALQTLEEAEGGVAGARRLDFTLGPGETLYIPRGTPHEVCNLTATTAVSANFIDQSNREEATAQARAKAARCAAGSARAANLMQIANALDEIDWPDVEEDVAAAEAEVPAEVDEVERMVVRLPAHERCMTNTPVRLCG